MAVDATASHPSACIFHRHTAPRSRSAPASSNPTLAELSRVPRLSELADTLPSVPIHLRTLPFVTLNYSQSFSSEFHLSSYLSLSSYKSLGRGLQLRLSSARALTEALPSGSTTPSFSSRIFRSDCLLPSSLFHTSLSLPLPSYESLGRCLQLWLTARCHRAIFTASSSVTCLAILATDSTTDLITCTYTTNFACSVAILSHEPLGRCLQLSMPAHCHRAIFTSAIFISFASDVFISTIHAITTASGCTKPTTRTHVSHIFYLTLRAFARSLLSHFIDTYVSFTARSASVACGLASIITTFDSTGCVHAFISLPLLSLASSPIYPPSAEPLPSPSPLPSCRRRRTLRLAGGGNPNPSCL